MSKVGKRYNATKMKLWLLRKAANKGKKHPMRFSGSADKLEALAAWLSGLK